MALGLLPGSTCSDGVMTIRGVMGLANNDRLKSESAER